MSAEGGRVERERGRLTGALVPSRCHSYFKQHILKNLEHQGFIEKVSIVRPPIIAAPAPASSASTGSTSSADAPSSSQGSLALTLAAARRESVLQKQLRKSARAQEKAPQQDVTPVSASGSNAGTKTVQEFVWALPRALTAPRAELAADPLLAAEHDRLSDRLERLYLARTNHDLVYLARDQRAHAAGARADRREGAIAAGRTQRTQDEMMTWPFRKEFLTTEKERTYLNKRRGLARPAKERRAQSWWDAAQSAREEARQG